MPLQATSGAASYDAFGGGVPVEPVYIEQIFQTYLYTGNGSTQTITNGIDLSGKGGLVWAKKRNSATDGNHILFDTARGQPWLSTNNTSAQLGSSGLINYNSDGFGWTFGSASWNSSGDTFASWTFRKQEKFFDVVTYTGDGATGHSINHNLGSTPGCIIFKRTDSTSDWAVYHRGITFPDDTYMYLNSTSAAIGGPPYIVSSVGSSSFTLGGNGSGGGNTITNASGGTYVAYLFAHDAGGFGLTGTDNVISCGSFTTDGSGVPPNVNLGYEPQWILHKSATSVYPWRIQDNMRGATTNGSVNYLAANSSAAESPDTGQLGINATGFGGLGGGFGASTTYIYIAIRRGPMKVPTSGTSVFEPLTRNGTGGATTVTSTVRPDTVLQNWRSGGLGSANHFMYDRLRGVAKALFTDTTDAESTQTATGINAFNNLSYGIAGAGSMNNGSALYADYVFTRAPSTFDVVCYTGTGTAGQTYTHNLGVAPELMIVKNRTTASQWLIYQNSLGNTQYLLFTTAASASGSFAWNNTSPTSSVFSVGTSGACNTAGENYVAYLFATCAGVSKVGSYTGNGSSQTINCGFTGGARFVMVKATSTTGNWIVADSARGIVAGNDPALYLNSTAAEVTGLDWIDADNSGFVVNETATIAANTNGVSYIFLAIA